MRKSLRISINETINERKGIAGTVIQDGQRIVLAPFEFSLTSTTDQNVDKLINNGTHK